MSEVPTITILLNGVRLFAHHGAYAEERERGNEFEIDLSVMIPRPDAATTDNLEDTVDYVSLMECIHLVSSNKHYTVLEAFVFDLCQEVLELHPEVISVTAEVKKLNPPMPHPLASVSIRMTLP